MSGGRAMRCERSYSPDPGAWRIIRFAESSQRLVPRRSRVPCMDNRLAGHYTGYLCDGYERLYTTAPGRDGECLAAVVSVSGSVSVSLCRRVSVVFRSLCLRVSPSRRLAISLPRSVHMTSCVVYNAVALSP